VTTTVLVIGGGGQLGASVVRRLLKDGFRVRILVRANSPARGEGTEKVLGDVDDIDSLRRAMTGCDAVHISLRGGPRDADYERVEHRGTARVAEVAAERGGVRLSYLSHMLAAPDSGSASLRAKWRAEHAIAASGVPHTIFRPTYFMETLPRHIRGSTATVLGHQRHSFHMLAAEDFGAMVSRALSTDSPVDQTLTVHGPEAHTIPDALRIYCDLCAPGVTVASRPLWLMAALDRTVLRGSLGDTIPLMRALQQFGEQGDPNEAARLLGPATTNLSDWCSRQATT
jgi:uncharacterized protein YbjT (DUF2867 family)